MSGSSSTLALVAPTVAPARVNERNDGNLIEYAEVHFRRHIVARGISPSDTVATCLAPGYWVRLVGQPVEDIIDTFLLSPWKTKRVTPARTSWPTHR